MRFVLKKIKLTLSIKKLAIFFGALYLFLSMQPFFLWSIPASSLIFLIPSFFLFYYIINSHKNTIARNNALIFFAALMFSLYMAIPIFGHAFLIGKILLFLPFLLFLMLSPEDLLDIFRIWKKILIFFAIYALVIYTLFLLQIDIPHWEIRNSEYIPATSRSKHFYRVYGLVVSSTNTVWRIGGILTQRVCGPFAEPGHFGIYIGFTLLIDRLLGNKINPILLITGILTLSPAFLILLILIESYRIIIEKRFNKKLYFAIFVVISSIAIFNAEEINERVIYITVDRHTNFDKRSPEVVRKKYETFTESPQILVGVGTKEFDTFGGSLSDPRGIIGKFGIIGLILSLSLLFLLLLKLKKKYVIFLLATVSMVYAHRAWMFESSYIYTFLIIAGASITIKENNHLKRIKEAQ